MPDYKQPSKFKKGYRTFRRIENKVSVYVFLFTLLMLVVGGLLYVTPAAPDSFWFVTMLSLFVVGLASVIGTWVKRTNKRNQQNKQDRRGH
jgi:CDP-diglyceride synthetase